MTSSSLRIEGYAIVSDDGMLADAQGAMPDSLRIDEDQRFFERGLDSVDVVVHGRYSHEMQPNSAMRRRIVVSGRVAAAVPDPSNARAVFWNPAGASFEQALELFGVPLRSAGIIGGTEPFGMFLDRYDVFYLSLALGVRLPGGRPVFPGVPARRPEEILAAHGLDRSQIKFADARLTIVKWQRSP